MRLGFIGTGNMAKAIVGGVIQAGIAAPQEIIGSDISETGRNNVKEQYGICVTDDNREVIEKADTVFLSVKPQFYAGVISEIKESIREEQVFITIAPGKTLAWMEEQFGGPVKLIRTMPNTPAMAGEGMTAVCANLRVTEEELADALVLLRSFGRVELIPERLMDVAVAVSGSSPAYVFLMIEAMADAAVSGGMPRAQAYQFAAQAIYGSAKMVLETGKHPGELKDMVCSPAGTTIEAVRVLEEKGFRSALIEAMHACMEISGKL